jgi:peptidoglycan hydrolase-like protein with peptidoglycan-binding domain
MREATLVCARLSRSRNTALRAEVKGLSDTPCRSSEEIAMRRIVLAGVSVAALALSGCGMFHSGSSNASNKGAQAPSRSAAQSQPTQAQPTQAQPASRSESGSSQAQNTGAASHDELMQAQQRLQADGLYKGKIDGRFGPQTKQALLQFQKQNGLAATGQLDHDTMAHLNAGEPGMSGSSAPPSGAVGTTGGGDMSTTPNRANTNNTGQNKK